jgi:phage tail sheath gpL-like
MIDPTIEAPFTGTEIDGSGAGSETPAKPKRALLTGLRSSSGAVLELVLTRISGDGDGDAAFGRSSMLADMCRSFRLQNKFTELWAIAQDEPSGGTAGTQTLTVSGTATASGTIALYIGGVRVEVDVVVGNTATDVATAIAAAITADTSLPVSCGAASAVATATARHKGAYEVRIEVGGRPGDVLPAGIASVIVAEGVAGAGTVDITDVTDLLGETPYDRIVLGMHTDTILDAAEAVMADRWGANVETDGLLVYAHKGASLSTITTYTTAPARNSQYGMIVAPPDTSFPTPVWRTAAMVAGIDLAESQVNTPRQWLPLTNISPGIGTKFNLSQRSSLVAAGCTTLKVDAGGRVVIDRTVTTYQKNGAGSPDKLFQAVGMMSAIAYLRWMWRVHIETRYPRALLGDDGAQVAPGIPLVTPSTIRGAASTVYLEAAELGLVDKSAHAAFLEALSVVRPSGNPIRVNSILTPTFLAEFLQSATTLRPQY